MPTLRPKEAELWREFEIARPCILGALLDAVVQGLRATGRVQHARLPGMADFELWATACEMSLWPAGTFSRAYTANRTAAIEGIIDADPIAACVRELMSERNSWTGSATDLWRVSVEHSSQTGDSTGRLKNPRALAGHLRRAQTFLRALGVDITFKREGRAGTRVIRIRRSAENNVSTVSTVSRARECGSEPASQQECRSGAAPITAIDMDSHQTPEALFTAADDADGADARANLRFGSNWERGITD